MVNRMKIAFIGLGQMGKPMAANLLRYHPQLTVISRSNRAYPDLTTRGATIASSMDDLSASDIVFLSLPGDRVVSEVLFGSGGLASRLKPGSLVVDTSTISPEAALRVNDGLAVTGIRFLDAPVSGMAKRAHDGTLTMMCGGDRGAYDEVLPYLHSMASKTFYMGDAGMGQLSKLINQLLYNINCAALAEVLPLAVKLGLDSEKVAEIVNSGTGRSHASDYFLERILKGDFSSAYPLQDAYKDLVNASAITYRHGLPTPLLSAASGIYQAALLQGYGNEDKGAMIKVYEQSLGVRFRAAANEA